MLASHIARPPLRYGPLIESSSACNPVGRVMLARERPDFGEAEQWLRRSLKVSAGAGCLAHFNLARLIRRVRPANLAGIYRSVAVFKNYSFPEVNHPAGC